MNAAGGDDVAARPGEGPPSPGDPPGFSSRHVRGSTLFLVGRFVGVGFDFLSHVVMVRYLTQADFGALAYAVAAVSLGASIAVLGLDKAVGRFVPIYEEHGDYPRVFGTLALVAVAVSAVGLLLSIGFLLLSDALTGSVITDPRASRVLVLLVFLVPLQALAAASSAMLAIYARPSAIFVRRFLVVPALQLAAIAAVALAGGPVEWMAIALIGVGVFAIGLDTVLLVGAMRRDGVLHHLDLRRIRFPVREVFGFSLPLLVSDSVFILRGNGVVVLIEYFRSTVEVALFRAATPLARQNQLVMQSFKLLYMPLAARLFARDDGEGLNDLYWTSAIWIAVFSFPVLVVSFSLAEPVTLLLYGERYAASAPILAVLALGYYLNGAVGFNGLTLRVYGRVRYMVGVDLVTTILTLAGSVWLVQQFGAMGGAVAVSASLILQNVLYHVGLATTTEISLFEWRYLRIYLAILVGSVGVLIAQIVFEPPIYMGVLLTIGSSLGVVAVARRTLRVGAMFPELLRLPLGRWLFGEPAGG